jgi:predicted O-methyltransferase YrrM
MYSPSRYAAAWASLSMRARLKSDSLLHRPPSGRSFERRLPSAIARLFGDTEDSRGLLAEVIEGRLEERILANLQEERRPDRERRFIAKPGGEWLEILRFLYVLVRHIRPYRVVETGVGPVGATTAYILEALRVNGLGHLWSLDANRYGAFYGMSPGLGIPEELRDRHTLVIGESRPCLPQLLEACGPIDLFLHDGDHTFSNMIFELGSAWPRATAGAYLLCDDANNSAIDRFASRMGASPLFLAYGHTPFGILRKPPMPAARSARG